MSSKILLYFLTTPIVIYAMDALNINQIFKKNKVKQAQLFYILLGSIMIYFVTNFIYDIFLSSKMM